MIQYLGTDPYGNKVYYVDSLPYDGWAPPTGATCYWVARNLWANTVWLAWPMDSRFAVFSNYAPYYTREFARNGCIFWVPAGVSMPGYDGRFNFNQLMKPPPPLNARQELNKLDAGMKGELQSILKRMKRNRDQRRYREKRKAREALVALSARLIDELDVDVGGTNAS